MKIQDIITENQQFTKVNTSPDNAWQMLGGKHPVQFAVEVLCPSRSVVSTIKNKIGTAYVIERDDSIAGNGIGIAIISPRFEGGRSAQDAYEKILDIIEQSGGQFNQSTQTTVYRQKQGVSEGVLTDIRYAWVRILTGLADKVISLTNSGELNTKQQDAIAHGTKELEQKLLAKISGHPREQQLRPYVDYIVKQVGQQTNFSDFSKTLYQMAKQFKPELGKFSEGVAEGTEPTEQAMDQSISDLVKDAMGARPNNDWMQRWMAMSADKKLALYQQLASQLD